MFCVLLGHFAQFYEGKVTKKLLNYENKIGLKICFGAAGSNGESELLGATFERFYLMTLLAMLSLSRFPS